MLLKTIAADRREGTVTVIFVTLAGQDLSPFQFIDPASTFSTILVATHTFSWAKRSSERVLC